MKRLDQMVEVNPLHVIVDDTLNFREDFDLPSLKDQIRGPKYIIDPVHLFLPPSIRTEAEALAALDKLDVIGLITGRGNRRMKAAKELQVDPTSSQELKDNLAKTSAILYYDYNREEQLEFMLDHGGSKPLSRCETIRAVLRLSKQMKGEVEICRLLYQNLARFTRNEKKATEAGGLEVGKARDTFLRNWLHGSVGQWILPGVSMGDEVYRQFILTERTKERSLSETEENERSFDCTRGAIKLLWNAFRADEKSKKWDPMKNSGPEFDKVLVELKRKYAAGEDTSTESERVSTAQMRKSATQMNSEGMKLPFMICAGSASQEDKNMLDELDAKYTRLDKVLPLVLSHLGRVKDLAVRDLLEKICLKGEAEVLTALAPFLSKETPVTKQPEAKQPEAKPAAQPEAKPAAKPAAQPEAKPAAKPAASAKKATKAKGKGKK